MSERVLVARAMVGICHMQVCAVADATDEEILTECNYKNPSGTTLGWVRVVRETDAPQSPVRCADDHGRIHFLVVC